MSSDIEMVGVVERRASLSPDNHPPQTATSANTSRRSSNNSVTNIQDLGGPSGVAISIPVLVHSPSPAPSGLPPTAQPASSAKPASSSAKPRSTKPAKPRSPSPPPVIPLRTIRLDIPLGGPSNYEVDISRQSKDTGQRPPTPPPAAAKKVADSSDSEEEDDEKSKMKKKKRKNVASEYYDTSDPFIDDSELALDERQFFAQTKQQGFYVSSGEVALMKDKTPKKPKSKKITFASGLHPSLATEKDAAVEGTQDAPIAIDAEDKRLTLDRGVGIAADAEHVGQKRKRQNSSVVNENGKRKKVVDESLFHPDLQTGIKELKELIAKESWENKGKFPPSLKPSLAKLAILAIRLDEYDEDFFSLMPTLFPYNKFTMTKLIKRTVFPDHLALLTKRQDDLLAQLAELAKAGFTKAEEEWEKSVVAWDKRQEKLRHEAAEASTGTGSAAPTRHPTEEMDVDGHPPATQAGGPEGGDGKEGKEHGQHPPAKRYRMTDHMKAIVWELVLLSNECCRLENEKNTLEGSVIQLSDQGLRKVLYQKIVAAYPEGWMSSGQISRDVSAMKKRLEREALEQHDDD
ncbi:hypothetical protein M413DRAFT_449791 [Hebeloma cylindrosporum]|uniref:Ubinuclein middle domain-containing protein n=1 Tax=Hebeloma cylindrosporum TaxID=76867 RepID=A0A0C2Y2T0_HEBCY|nr:hypothetical protein M413DRAFT_449791 [Hebeloma cylindrosporum h7]